MKKILALILGLTAGGLTLPTTAEAGSLRIGHATISVSGHHSCGCAIQTKRVFVGYDCYRRPVYRYYSVPTVHRCSSHRQPSHYSHRSHSTHSSYYGNQRNPYLRSGSHYRGSRYYQQPSCNSRSQYSGRRR
ncbi:MAG: hypothetical protein ACSHYF_10570 [Verrucomicrobiaceae bacterium]